MLRCDLMLTADWLLPVAPDNTVLRGQAVAIDAGRIVALGDVAQVEANYAADTVVRLDHHIVLPGLVNAHGHAAMTLLRGTGEDLPLKAWLEDKIWPLEGQYANESFVAEGANHAVAEMLLCGTTTFSDMYFHPEITARVAQHAGMRAQIAFPVIRFNNTWSHDVDDCFHKGLALVDQYRDNPLLHIAFGPHAAYTVERADLERVLMYSAELDLPVQIHLHETAEEVAGAHAAVGHSWIRELHDIGLLSPNLQAVHMTQLDDTELDLVAESGVHVVHCPHSNLKLASGFCPTTALTERGVNIALGTDGAASNNALDVFAEARLASLLAKGLAQSPTVMDAKQTLHVATLGGARALGMDADIGSIEVGKYADIIAVDIDALQARPLYDAHAQLLHTMSGQRVTDVWVAGRRLVDAGTLTTIDGQQILEHAVARQNLIGDAL